jgi:hypothetical protein
MLDSQRHKIPQRVTLILTPAPLKYCSQETMKHKKERKKAQEKKNEIYIFPVDYR